MINPFGFIATVLYFELAKKVKNVPIIDKFPPVVIAGTALIVTLEVFHIDFDTFNESASYITLLLIPATIALGYPIYKNIKLLKQYKRIIYSAFLYPRLLQYLELILLQNYATVK